jgi:hypothetical protein
MTAKARAKCPKGIKFHRSTKKNKARFMKKTKKEATTRAKFTQPTRKSTKAHVFDTYII